MDYKDIIGSDTESSSGSTSSSTKEKQALSSSRGDSAKIKVHLEITLNLPRTKSFLNKRQIGQQNEYLCRYNIMLSSIKSSYISNEQVFENCKDGTVHLHACVICWINPKLSLSGYVSDLAKIYLATINKKYSNFLPGCMFTFDDGNTVTYKCASIKIALKKNQEERLKEWSEYIRKTL